IQSFKRLSRYGPFDAEMEWEAMEKILDDEKTQSLAPRAPRTKLLRSSGSSQPQAKKVPEYISVPASKVQKELFKPGKGGEAMPNSVRELLLVTAAPGGSVTTRPPMIQLLCHTDRMYVRIKKEAFTHKKAYKFLKIGSCPVNAATSEYYFLLYMLKSNCGFTTQSLPDHVAVASVLHYKPDPDSPVVRELPFSIPVQCRYQRFFHSYKVGFHPKPQGGTVFRPLKSLSGGTIIPQDASGQQITKSKIYTLGQPMYFVVKKSEKDAGNQRLYVNKCFVTASQDPSKTPKYTVLDNQGCMIDGKVTSQSAFVSHTSKMEVKFRIGAFVFKDMASDLASLKVLSDSFRPLTPTASAKSCNYIAATKNSSRNLVSSHSWEVDYKAGYAEVEPDLTDFDAERYNLEDHAEFMKYWEHE
uniref:Zona pellucida glycoprotein 3c n=1 Tax=Myripristis murdjan TaxID=586833 RepID=A0A667XLM5_9TELE